jgi:hypothetical protein
MKYIKKFETIDDMHSVDFTVGDYVYAINNYYNSNTNLNFDKKYQILSIHDHVMTEKNRSTDPYDFCDIGCLDHYNLKRFMSEEEHNLNKYNL